MLQAQISGSPKGSNLDISAAKSLLNKSKLTPVGDHRAPVIVAFPSHSVISANSVSISQVNQNLEIFTSDDQGRTVMLHHDAFGISDFGTQAFWALYDKFNVRNIDFSEVAQPKVIASLVLHPNYYKISSRQLISSIADAVEEMKPSQRLTFGGFDIIKGDSDNFSIIFNSNFLRRDEALYDFYGRDWTVAKFRQLAKESKEFDVFFSDFLPHARIQQKFHEFCEQIIALKESAFIKPSDESRAVSIFKITPLESSKVKSWQIATSDQELRTRIQRLLAKSHACAEDGSLDKPFTLNKEQLMHVLKNIVNTERLGRTWILESVIPQLAIEDRNFEFRLVFKRQGGSFKFQKNLSICKRSQPKQMCANLYRGSESISIEEAITQLFPKAGKSERNSIFRKLKNSAVKIASSQAQKERSLARKFKLDKSGLLGYIAIDLVFDCTASAANLKLHLVEIQLGPGLTN